MRIAGAPISWGVCEVPGWGHQMTAERVLTEMRAPGIEATEFGPDGFLPADPDTRAKTLASHGLAVVGGFVPMVLHDATVDRVADLEECAIAVGEKDPDADAEPLLDCGVHTAVVKLGPHGVLARTGDETVRVAPVPVEVVNGRAPATRSARRSATACCRAGRPSWYCGSPTPLARTSPPGWPAHRRCPPDCRSRN